MVLDFRTNLWIDGVLIDLLIPNVCMGSIQVTRLQKEMQET
jgi:hypothetical protein